MLRPLQFLLIVLAGAVAPAYAQLIDLGPWTGAVTPHTAEIRMILTESRLTNLEVSKTKDFARYVTYPQLARKPTHALAMAHFSLSRLESDTSYFYRVKAGRIREYTSIGTFKTLPRAGHPSSFRFAFASGNMTGSKAGVFSEIRFQKPLFFLHLGNALNETELPKDLEGWQNLHDLSYESFTQAELYRSVPLVYTWAGMDHGGAEAHQAYRNYLPHFPLPADQPNESETAADQLNPISQSFSVGRVRFIVLDTQTARTPSDGENPSMLGEWQWHWLESELRAAALTYPIIFIASSVPWHASQAFSGPQDHWGFYPKERARLRAWLKSEQISGVSIVSGNGGVLALNISEGELGNITELQSGIIDLRREPMIGKWSGGHLIPDSTEEFFGIVDIEDKRNEITVTFRGMNQHGFERFQSSFTVPAESK
mgnify:FL=1